MLPQNDRKITDLHIKSSQKEISRPHQEYEGKKIVYHYSTGDLYSVCACVFFLQQYTLLGGVHGGAGLALEGLGKVVRVLDHAVDAPLLG